MSDTLSRSKFRFSLKALLIIMTLLAVGIGAYFAGYRNGYIEGAGMAARKELAYYLEITGPIRDSVEQRD